MPTEKKKRKLSGAAVTTYKPIFAKKKVADYLATCVDEETTKIVQKNEESGYTQYKNVLTIKLPTVEGFARFVKKSKRTLETWAKLYPEFREGMNLIKEEQKQRLIERSLEGKYNPTIAKLILATNHGMSDKSDITTDGKPITTSFNDEQINRIADRIARRQKSDGDTPGEKQSN